ncbi:protein phosphatase [Vagococcus penaei]|uniref:protein-serine/threonine phosphatase n=1 Tax=Vagococcus penaei TaxID=633807 RepID=A0A1Q2D6Y0_9ENTE|nr:Stp1/IreP family PP2C-type Ser/Thr phosphatase [Vagococcus penaei]AQP54061.1 protein phosphatase [Vagococcus penaei]RSU01706.1 protein phosphatase [Vagococcus penaei]
MQIECQTNVGRKRKNNQDTVGTYVNQAGIVLAIVADGMGGHLAGDQASFLAVTGLGAVWEATTIADHDAIGKWLVDRIQEENDIIYAEGTNNPEKYGMGTTIVAAIPLNGQLLLAHVGDSRAYLVRNHEIKQLTEDHSLVNELVKTGEITKEMALNHPKKNILVRSVGVPGRVDVDLSLLTIQENDQILLCSDGLTNMLSDIFIKSIVTQEISLNQKVEQLITEANEAGGTDNITVLLMSFKSDGKEAYD